MRKAVVFLILSLLILVLQFPITRPMVSTVEPYSLGPIGFTDYPWTMFRANAARSGATSASGPATNNTMWSLQTTGLLYSSPAVSDGMVFIASYDGNIYAIDEYSGAQRWVFNANQYVYASPAVSNGLVFVTTMCPTSVGPLSCKSGSAYALDEQAGGVVWQRIVNAPISSSPVVADGRIFYGSLAIPNNAQFYARYAATGNGNWTGYLTDIVESSPSVDNGRVFVGQLDGAVVAFNENTGAQIWRVVPVGADNIQTALAAGNGRVFVGTSMHGVVALDENTGSTLWTYPVGGSNSTSVSLVGGRVFFGTGGGTVYALNATTGVRIWSRALPAAVASSPAVALGSGTLLVGANNHRMYSLSMATGAIQWSYLTGGNIASSPAVADGRAFFGSQDGKVYAVGAIPPTLHANLSASLASIRSGMDSGLRITVTNGTTLQPGVSLSFTSTVGGTFTPAVMVSQGIYASNFTAPSVGSKTNTTITVTASRPSYVDGTNQTTITLNPLPTLTVDVASKASSIQPGGNVVLMIRVTNATLLISGAALTLSSAAGGSFSGVADSGNGNYTVVFNAPAQSANPDIITVQANKPGFTQGQGQAAVSISGIPDLTTLQVAGVPFIIILAGAALAFLLVIVIVITQRRSAPRHYTPEKPSFTY